MQYSLPSARVKLTPLRLLTSAPLLHSLQLLHAPPPQLLLLLTSTAHDESMSEIREKWKALGDKAKQKYIEKAKLSSEAYKEQKVKVDPQENSKETFITRTQLKTACDIIRNLEPQQVESVKAMGFGGLLRLKCTRLDRKLCEQLDVRGKKTNENSLPAKVSMDMKGTSSPVVNEKKGKKEPSFDSSTSPLTNKEKDRKEQSSGHLTSPLKANQEENTKKPSLSHLTSPLKTNKEQDIKEPKIKPSLKRSRKMGTNIGDIMSSTAPPTIGMNKRQKKCQQEMPRTRLKGSQPVKKNANEKPTMECQQEMARTRLKESQPVKKNANEKPTIGLVRELILRFVFDTTLSVREQLCNLGISYATRSDFMSLRKNGWVVGEIINAVALRKTLIQSKRDPNALWPSWYLPTYLASYALNGANPQPPGVEPSVKRSPTSVRLSDSRRKGQTDFDAPMAVALKANSFLQLRNKSNSHHQHLLIQPTNTPRFAIPTRKFNTPMAVLSVSTPTVGLSETFTRLRNQGKVIFFDFWVLLCLISAFSFWVLVAFIPYITAGDPDLSTTAEALKILDACGSDIIELGVPYSDPLADGPVIQAAATRALARGTNFNAILSMLKEVVPQISCPLALFTYYNPILKRGVEQFMSTVKDVGVHGLVVPDVPLEETESLRKEAVKNNIELVLLTTPTTPTERMKAIVEVSEGFVYLVSSVGVTGARASVSGKVESLLKDIKEATSKPVAVGFGISKPEHVKQVVAWGADGVIVGSAMVKLLGEAKSPEEGLKELEIFAKSLKSALP
ncbi:hypothetical protein RHGRI_035810 [Rhododendron griersonianum]|uniref:Tryptophan synthase n=1 Tax=Rhododendron griersonianum TaxID=479676 RepID=A0AAV6HPQ1_9ERIC|nr:hypothetical protein RHGRI_035810 [Rhododendron griersonianum]